MTTDASESAKNVEQNEKALLELIAKRIKGKKTATGQVVKSVRFNTEQIQAGVDHSLAIILDSGKEVDLILF